MTGRMTRNGSISERARTFQAGCAEGRKGGETGSSTRSGVVPLGHFAARRSRAPGSPAGSLSLRKPLNEKTEQWAI